MDIWHTYIVAKPQVLKGPRFKNQDPDNAFILSKKGPSLYAQLSPQIGFQNPQVIKPSHSDYFVSVHCSSPGSFDLFIMYHWKVFARFTLESYLDLYRYIELIWIFRLDCKSNLSSHQWSTGEFAHHYVGRALPGSLWHLTLDLYWSKELIKISRFNCESNFPVSNWCEFPDH